jgi:hypothetical protein
MVEFDSPYSYTRSTVVDVIHQSSNLVSLHTQLWNAKRHLDFSLSISGQRRIVRMNEMQMKQGTYIGEHKNKANYEQNLVDLDAIEVKQEKFLEEEYQACFKLCSELCRFIDNHIKQHGTEKQIAFFENTKGDQFVADQINALYKGIQDVDDSGMTDTRTVGDVIKELPIFNTTTPEQLLENLDEDTSTEIMPAAKQYPDTLLGIVLTLPKIPHKEINELCLPQCLKELK